MYAHTHMHTNVHAYTHVHNILTYTKGKMINHDTIVLAMMFPTSHVVELFPGKLVSPVLDQGEVPSVPLSPPPTFDLVSFCNYLTLIISSISDIHRCKLIRMTQENM